MSTMTFTAYPYGDRPKEGDLKPAVKSVHVIRAEEFVSANQFSEDLALLKHSQGDESVRQLFVTSHTAEELGEMYRTANAFNPSSLEASTIMTSLLISYIHNEILAPLAAQDRPPLKWIDVYRISEEVIEAVVTGMLKRPVK